MHYDLTHQHRTAAHVMCLLLWPPSLLHLVSRLACVVLYYPGVAIQSTWKIIELIISNFIKVT